MAVSDQQKLDFLLKKIGYTKTKTGSVVGTGAISGTPKQPFAEAIPSPLVVPNSLYGMKRVQYLQHHLVLIHHK